VQCPKWIVSLGVVLGLAAGAHANVYRFSNLGEPSMPHDGAIDTWLVECTDSRTHLVVANVKNVYGTQDAIKVIAIGFTEPLTGQVDIENVPEGDGQSFPGFSVPAWVKRVGMTQGSTKALVEVELWGKIGYDDYAATYLLDLRCMDVNYAEVGNPTVTALEDQ
jgi:hypothetical protein